MNEINSGKIKIVVDTNENHSHLPVKKKVGRPAHLKTADTQNQVYKLSTVSLSFSNSNFHWFFFSI